MKTIPVDVVVKRASTNHRMLFLCVGNIVLMMGPTQARELVAQLIHGVENWEDLEVLNVLKKKRFYVANRLRHKR